jgi:hypothetical protein
MIPIKHRDALDAPNSGVASTIRNFLSAEIAVDVLPLRSNADASYTRAHLVDEALSFTACATISNGWATLIRVRNLIMKRIFAVIFAVVCIIGHTPAFAAGAHGGGGIRAGHGAFRGSAHGARPMRVPDLRSRIPAPLAEPAQPPAINGPLRSTNGIPTMGLHQ